MECQGSDCEVDDYMWIKRCDEDEDEQQFMFEYVPAYGADAGRIRPYHEPQLCLERTRVNAHQLRPCSPIDNINTTQIVIGFREAGRFEMHPYGFDENTTALKGPKCLNNHHHPKDEEIVRAEWCKNASRANKVSRWIVHNPVTIAGGTSGGSDGGSQGGGDGDPEVDPVAGDYCTADNPCQQCQGDCDEDEDCAGNLVCFQRDAGEAVPSCQGGEDSDSSKSMTLRIDLWSIALFFVSLTFYSTSII